MQLIPVNFLPIEILLQTIITDYLISSYCVTVISERPLNVDLPQSFMYLHSNNSDDLANYMLNASEMGCSDYIVQTVEPESFIIAFEKVVHMANVRRSDRKIIMLPIESNSLMENYSQEYFLTVLSMKAISFVPNILLILPTNGLSDCETYDLITHQFVGSGDVHKPLYLDKWDSCNTNFEKYANLFPHDMSNLHGKTVKVAAFTYTPYVLLDIPTNVGPVGRDGIEIRIVEEFCRWINCTIEIVRDDAHEWGEIYENLTGVGVIGNVFEDRADLGITALYSWYEEFVVMDFSTPFLRTGITCIAPSPRLLASWEMPLLPFSLYMWMALMFTFLYACVALIIAQGFKTDKVFLTTFGIMITQSQPETGFLSWRIRSVVGWMMMTGLVLDNAYGGGLASTFTVPKYEPSIDTIQDVVDRQVTWGATHDAWIFSLILSQEPLIKNLLNLFRTYPADELKRRSFTRNMAFSIEKLPAENFAIGEYITKEASLDLTIMVEEFYYEQCVVMMRKSSQYTNKLSDLIGRLHESGLLLAWETQIALQYLDYEVQLEVKLSRTKRDVENIEPLALRHVEGIFIMYAIGVILAVIFLFLEIIVHRHKAAKFRDNFIVTSVLIDE